MKVEEMPKLPRIFAVADGTFLPAVFFLPQRGGGAVGIVVARTTFA